MMNMQGRCFKIFEITSLIKETLESQFYSVMLEGEISNFRPSSTGHYYFSLKDNKSMISAVMFKNAAKNLKVIPTDGEMVKVKGDISVYPQRGSYQIICSSIEKSGEGNILAELEKRKQRFAEEGLFDSESKKQLPSYPEKVAVVTSPTGAAIKDILRVLKRRNNKINLIILPAPVQGDDAAGIIAKQIRYANSVNIADVLIIGRGGGSIEDLLPFSDEKVVRAVYESEIPVISAVGHEIDNVLSDYAADLRAPTPSAAAEIVSSELSSVEERIRVIENNLIESLERKFEIIRLRLDNNSRFQLERGLRNRLNPLVQRVDDIKEKIGRSITERITSQKHHMEIIRNSIESASPEAILKRGYASVSAHESEKIIKSGHQVKSGDKISIRFYTDILSAEAGETRELKES
jgi:exodeoxyribonuclease VII large subunit